MHPCMYIFKTTLNAATLIGNFMLNDNIRISSTYTCDIPFAQLENMHIRIQYYHVFPKSKLKHKARNAQFTVYATRGQ